MSECEEVHEAARSSSQGRGRRNEIDTMSLPVMSLCGGRDWPWRGGLDGHVEDESSRLGFGRRWSSQGKSVELANGR